MTHPLASEALSHCLECSQWVTAPCAWEGCGIKAETPKPPKTLPPAETLQPYEFENPEAARTVRAWLINFALLAIGVGAFLAMVITAPEHARSQHDKTRMMEKSNG